MNKIIVLFLMISVIFITYTLTKDLMVCPDGDIQYKFIPRTLDEENENPRFATDIFRKMFEHSSPWIDSITIFDRKKHDDINKFFISQV